MRTILVSAAAFALAAPAFAHDHGATDADDAPAFEITVPAGTYGLDKTHASLTWQVMHLGLSKYTARFTDFDATVEFDPAAPETSSVTATINPTSVETDYPGDYKAGHADSPYETWDEDLAQNPDWFSAGEHPEITFTSTAIEVTGPNTGVITGDLTFRGVTAPVSLDATFNGELNPHPFVGVPAIGFSASGTLDRTTFGMERSVPFVGAEVHLLIEAEFFQNVDDDSAE